MREVNYDERWKVARDLACKINLWPTVENLRHLDAALRRARVEGLDEALQLCAIIENHYVTKGIDERVAKIQRHAVAGVRQSIIDHMAKLDARAAQIEEGE